MTNYISTSNTQHKNYSEAAALQVLIRQLRLALVEMNDHFDDPDYLIAPDINIVVGGVSTAFSLGGPQAQAIYTFVNSIAEENGYCVDLKEHTVTE